MLCPWPSALQGEREGVSTPGTPVSSLSPSLGPAGGQPVRGGAHFPPHEHHDPATSVWDKGPWGQRCLWPAGTTKSGQQNPGSGDPAPHSREWRLPLRWSRRPGALCHLSPETTALKISSIIPLLPCDPMFQPSLWLPGWESWDPREPAPGEVMSLPPAPHTPSPLGKLFLV